MPDTVVLNAAYVFDCPECGHANFGRMVEAELTAEESEYLKQRMIPDYGEEWKANEDAPFEEGIGLVTLPDNATCEKCGKVFEVWREETPDPEDLPERFRPET